MQKIDLATHPACDGRMNPWILAARPRTLGAAAIPVLAGAALAFSVGALDVASTALAMACALLIQIATNYFNDAIDHAKGADHAGRVGPARATAQGLLSGRAVLLGGCACLLLAAALSVPLISRAGWPILALGALSLLLAYAYTGGPFPLAYLGLGEVFVVLFFGVFAVAGTFYVNALAWSGAAILAGVQVGLHSAVLLAVNNLRDADGDRAAGKKTLAARFGLTFARRECATMVLAPFALGYCWLPLGYFWAFILPLFALPLAVWLARACLAATPGQSAVALLPQAAALHATFGLFLCLALAAT